MCADSIPRMCPRLTFEFGLTRCHHHNRKASLEPPPTHSSEFMIDPTFPQPLPKHESSHIPTLAMTDSTIGVHDVLLGRGGLTNSHTGNKRYRTIVLDHQAEYLRAQKKEKAVIARKIVAIVQENGGRFLKRDTCCSWIQVTDKKAREKTSQALREGLDVRNNRVRLSKLARRFSDDVSSSDEEGVSRSHQAKRLVVPGWVVSKLHSPAVVSLSGEPIPDLGDELHAPQKQTIARVPVTSIRTTSIDHMCEV
jgi:hypothetical protein